MFVGAVIMASQWRHTVAVMVCLYLSEVIVSIGQSRMSDDRKGFTREPHDRTSRGCKGGLQPEDWSWKELDAYILRLVSNWKV